MDFPWRLFAHCPRCGATQDQRDAPFRCRACGFTYFFNTATAVAGLLRRDDGRVLFIRRAKEPAKGALGLPGGFVDPGESAEEALRREVREEVGLEIASVRYLSSHANTYAYAGVRYPTLDLFYDVVPIAPDTAQALDAVDALVWDDPLTVDLDGIAFESMRAALRGYRAGT
jgi:8-oxo-dGTP pyrophosphatase MutT (NUDIX family)